MNNKKDVAQLFGEVVQSCHPHRDPSILTVKNRKNKDPQRKPCRNNERNHKRQHMLVLNRVWLERRWRSERSILGERNHIRTLDVENVWCGGNDRQWGFAQHDWNRLGEATEFVLIRNNYHDCLWWVDERKNLKRSCKHEESVKYRRRRQGGKKNRSVKYISCHARHFAGAYAYRCSLRVRVSRTQSAAIKLLCPTPKNVILSSIRYSTVRKAPRSPLARGTGI